MSSRVTCARFVGREAQLAELEAALLDAGEGRPALVVIAGESGVGKSRLVEEVADVARGRGARVLCGDCVLVGEGELPYAPLVGALRPLARAQDPVLGRLPAAVRTELARLLPALGAADVAPPPADAAGQGRLFEALLTLLDTLAADDPLVLLVEDIHWADASTRAFLAFLARSLDRERILAVATYRADELHRRHPLRPLLADLERDPRVRRVELAPLTRDELAAVLADIVAPAAAPELVDRLHARSGGNPLWAEELLAAGLDGRGALPSTLRDALMVRVERLDDDAQELLRALAVGGRMDHELLGEVSGLGSRELRDALRTATAAHLVVAHGEEHAFRHALLREVVLDDLLPGERAVLHLAIAQALERRAGPGGAQLAAGIAHHYAAGGDRPAALAARVRAADAAEGVHAFGEAATLLEQALESFAQVADAEAVAGLDRVGLLARAAEAHITDGEGVRGEALLRSALEGVDDAEAPLRAAALRERLSRAQWGLGHGQEALATAQGGLALLDPAAPTRERAALLSWLAKARMLQGRYRDTLEQGAAAVAAAEAAGDELARGRALDPVGVARIRMGEVEEGAAALGEAVNIARRHDRPHDAAVAYTNLADALHIVGRSEEALGVAREGLAATSERLTRSYSCVERTMGEILFDLGDWTGAAKTLPATTVRLAGNDLVWVELSRAELSLGRGEHDAAAQSLEEADAATATSTEPQFLGPLGALSAELRRRAGDLSGARAAVEAALDRLEFCTEDVMRLGRVAAAGVAVEADRAQRARDLGDAEDERAARSFAEALALRVDAAAEEGGTVEEALRKTAHADLARARGSSDPARWAAAAAAWDAVARPYPAALARRHEAEARLDAGDRAGAEAVARTAHRAAKRIGATWLAAEVEGLASRARLTLVAPEDGGVGSSERPEPDDDPFGLTPRERQVLALLAGGATNRQVGDTLYMAEKTASVHVSRILAKLGVRSRLQAAAVAHRLGLVA